MTRYTDAAQEQDLERFLTLALPPSWGGVRARIVESGAFFGPPGIPRAPRWSAIPCTVKKAETDDHAALKSIIYRVHDCLHQLWGLPHPVSFSEEEHYFYKRVQMCGEVAVLCLTEFVFAEWNQHPDLRSFLDARNALLIRRGPLAGRTTEQIAARLDGILHRNFDPKWAREDATCQAFIADYRPMLENDRWMADQNWALMKATGWTPHEAPQSLAPDDLDGLELTLWMIQDFERSVLTTTRVDTALRDFNRARRVKVHLPTGWIS